MPDIEHHRLIPFGLVDHKLRTDGFTVVRSPDGSITVTGLCPGCAGRTVTTWEFGLPGQKGVFRRVSGERQPPMGRRTVCCDCGHPHPERPADVWSLGCGAYWEVDLG